MAERRQYQNSLHVAQAADGFRYSLRRAEVPSYTPRAALKCLPSQYFCRTGRSLTPQIATFCRASRLAQNTAQPVRPYFTSDTLDFSVNAGSHAAMNLLLASGHHTVFPGME